MHLLSNACAPVAGHEAPPLVRCWGSHGPAMHAASKSHLLSEDPTPTHSTSQPPHYTLNHPFLVPYLGLGGRRLLGEPGRFDLHSGQGGQPFLLIRVAHKPRGFLQMRRRHWSTRHASSAQGRGPFQGAPPAAQRHRPRAAPCSRCLEWPRTQPARSQVVSASRTCISLK